MAISSKGNNKFVDYFVICGLDLSSGLELDHTQGDAELQNTPLDRSYKCKVLTHFPETVSWNPFDKDAVCMLSLPNGLRFRTQKHSLVPKFHSFVITKEDGRRCYGFSFVFFEKVHNKICSAMQTLQAMHLTEFSGHKKNSIHTQNTRSLPRHFKMLSQNFSSAQSYYDITKDTLFVMKGIVLISQFPYVYASYQFLFSMYKGWQEQNSFSLETYINYLLNEINVPEPGYTLSFYVCPISKVIIHRPDHNKELPLFDYAVREVFSLVDVDSLLSLFTSLLLENQILICSADHEHLMLVAETLCCLLFPFTWPHVYVPILPASLERFLDAPVPFVMGLTRTSSRINIPSEANLCIIDIDAQTIQLPEDLPLLPYRSEFLSEVKSLLIQFRIPIRSCYKQMRPSDFRYKIQRNNTSVTSIPMAASSENLNMSLSMDDYMFYKNSCFIGGTMDSSAVQSVTRFSTYCSDSDDYIEDQCFNAAVREIFLNKFLHLLLTYENFIIHPNQDREQWISNKESFKNFDKTSFLSEQPQQYFPFLSQFIETQMFTNFVDSKIQSFWSEKEPYLRILDQRIQILKKKHEDISFTKCNINKCSFIYECQQAAENIFSHVDIIIPPPVDLPTSKFQYSADTFPVLNLFEKNQNRSNKRSRTFNDNYFSDDSEQIWKKYSEAHPLGTCEKLTIATQSEPHEQSPLPVNPSPAVIAQTNWNFVDKLLKDCRCRTKKMLVAKMGFEAVELGHNVQHMLMEENALILGLCDLLERIWSHGCQNKQGKSALWFHLMKYRELEEVNELKERADNMLYITDDGCVNSAAPLVRSNSFSKSYAENSREENSTALILENLPVSLIYDMKYIETMTELKTSIGFAKAWIRLCLEKKLLSRHLKTLLTNTTLLKTMYKRYAFVRCDEEKEQFLFHLLSLNAVDYFCFTNFYVNARMPYRVLIQSSTKIAASMATNCWIILSGNMGETEKIEIPKKKLDFVFYRIFHGFRKLLPKKLNYPVSIRLSKTPEFYVWPKGYNSMDTHLNIENICAVFSHKNLGLLTLLKIGQINKCLSLKWLIDWIVVRNEITGHIYSFPCGRWLGGTVDDDSSERLLVGKRVIEAPDRSRYMMTTSRTRSPSMPPIKQQAATDTEVQQRLGECVNNIIKYYYGNSKENESLATLLCGPNGLVNHLETALSFGFKSSRLFGRKLQIWDFILKVKEEIEANQEMEDDDNYLCNLIIEIEKASSTLGREGRFQVFICVAVRDHMINTVLKTLASAKVVSELYDEHSFLRKKSLLYFLTHLLDSLYDIDLCLENCLTLGITLL